MNTIKNNAVCGVTHSNATNILAIALNNIRAWLMKLIQYIVVLTLITMLPCCFNIISHHAAGKAINKVSIIPSRGALLNEVRCYVFVMLQ